MILHRKGRTCAGRSMDFTLDELLACAAPAAKGGAAMWPIAKLLWTLVDIIIIINMPYSTRCYFNGCSKANMSMSQLNLPHGTDN